MSAYYNEHDPFAAAWLRELIKEGLIADGTVDERSITDVQADDLRGFIQCHFFAGIGGWSYALRLAGWPDDRSVWTGSCPCQPASNAGHLLGEKDERDLWPVWFPLIEECDPATIFGEQVASAAGLQWLDRLHDDLEGADYAVASADLCAPCVGAPDIRQRLWFVADRDSARLAMGNVSGKYRAPEIASSWREFERVHAARTWPSWSSQSGIGVFDDGVSHRLLQGSITGFGNAIKPQVAQAFIEACLEAIGDICPVALEY
jgi:DNA (cytosine-5)-methyltransferase 1